MIAGFIITLIHRALILTKKIQVIASCRGYDDTEM